MTYSAPQSLIQTHREFVGAIDRNDRAALRSLWDERRCGILVHISGHQYRAPAQCEKLCSYYRGRLIATSVLERAKATERGDVGWVTSLGWTDVTWAGGGTPPIPIGRVPMRMTAVYVQCAGEWRAAHAHTSEGRFGDEASTSSLGELV